MSRALLLLVLLTSGRTLAGEPSSAEFGPKTLRAEPESFVLVGKASRQQLLVSLDAPGSRHDDDRTREATYRSLDPTVVHVDAGGHVTPRRSGATRISISVDDLETQVSVRVEKGDSYPPESFERDIQPVLTRGGCNSGPCHGKQRGQGGFQLSLFGFDDNFDFDAVVRDSRGRRLFPAAPDRSLLLLKATAQIPHGGGRRFERESALHGTIERWIRSGAARRSEDAAMVTSIRVSPRTRVLRPRDSQQIRVTALYSDGTEMDVTHLAAFQSNESPIAKVDEHGLVETGPLPGEAAIMARFQGRFATVRISIPLPGAVAPDVFEKLPRRNFIDELVWKKLELLGIEPSKRCDDLTYLRRAHLDVLGRLPAPSEVRAFAADERPDKRDRLVDKLLARPEFVDHWANKWMDLLRPNPYRVGIKAVRSLDSWIRQSFREEWSYDRFVRELVTARGSTFRNGATTVFRDRRSPDELVTMFSQLFLGIRLECAKCHQHPFEVWSQRDYYSLAAYFADVGRKGTGLSPPISGSEEFVFAKSGGSVAHPRTGERLAPKPLFGTPPSAEGRDDLREPLAEWLTSDGNPFFARVMANRVWADVMGRGLVEPVDDLRESNPPTNPELLDALSDRFRRDGYSLKKLLRVILRSHVYGLESRPTERNVADTRNYSRHYRTRLRAEVLLDALDDITGVRESFSAMPPGSRAVELWTHRSSSVFLDTFGRPDPNQDPPCFRTSDTTVVQALHLMNSPRIHAKVTSEEGLAARLAKSSSSPEEIVEELYLFVYSRFPTSDERARAARFLAADASRRRRGVEDLLWALLNTPEFLFED